MLLKKFNLALILKNQEILLKSQIPGISGKIRRSGSAGSTSWRGFPSAFSTARGSIFYVHPAWALFPEPWGQRQYMVQMGLLGQDWYLLSLLRERA